MLIELLRKRRSVRQFQNKKVEKEKIDALVESVLRSPSSRSLNPWEFVVVTEPEIIAELSQAKPHGASFMKNAPLAIVICADPSKSDVWIEDCSIATLLLHLEATDLGLGSCWIQIRMRDHSNEKSSENYIKELLCLKEDTVVEAIVAIGYSKEEKAGHANSSLLYDRVSYNRNMQEEDI